MYIVAICGSPRRGNTEWMLDTLLSAAAGAGAKTNLILLRNISLKPCRGCLACEKRDEQGVGACRIDDDVRKILPELLAADVIVLGTPGYMGLLSGLLKTFLDRTCPVWPALKGKGLAGIAVAEEDTFAAIPNIKTYGNLLGMRWLGSVTALAKLPKEASRIPRLEKRLQRLGRKLTALPPA
jgi:multimeric flavodoxin WrbA